MGNDLFHEVRTGRLLEMSCDKLIWNFNLANSKSTFVNEIHVLDLWIEPPLLNNENKWFINNNNENNCFRVGRTPGNRWVIVSISDVPIPKCSLIPILHFKPIPIIRCSEYIDTWLIPIFLVTILWSYVSNFIILSLIRISLKFRIFLFSCKIIR